MSEQKPRPSEAARHFASLHRSALVAGGPEGLPVLLTVDGVAQLLRTTQTFVSGRKPRR